MILVAQGCALILVAQGCATASSGGASSPTAAADAERPLARLEPAERERLRGLAPDFLARAERAADRAERASDPAIAAEHAACAALLLEAAKYEADRIGLERRLLAEELRRDAALRALAAERFAILALDASDDVQRDSRSATEPRSAAELTRRARLRLAAARALGAETGQLAEAERHVRQAGDRPDRARAALDLAERVLARTRAGR